MDKIKKLMHSVDEELSDAMMYATRAEAWHKDGCIEAAGLFAAMAKAELEHAANNERVMGMVAERHRDHADKHMAIEMIRDVTRNRIEETKEEIHEILERMR